MVESIMIGSLSMLRRGVAGSLDVRSGDRPTDQTSGDETSELPER